MASLISDRMANALSEQVGAEYAASLQYLMIASYFEREALPKLAAMFHEQSAEEAGHGLKLVRYVTEAGGVVQIPEVPAGKSDFGSVAEAVQLALDSEVTVATSFDRLMDLAIEERDHLARGLLQWYVDEQLEEVSRMSDLLRVVQRAGDNLLYVEQYVGDLPPLPA